MRELVIFRDRQEIQSADFNNAQAFARATFDDLVRDAVTRGKGFAGFEITQATASDVVVAPGRLYAAGAMYYRDTSLTVQLASMIPMVTKKKVAIVVWGVSQDIDTEARDFLVDVQTGETEPQVVAMHSARAAQLQAIAGIEAPDPQPPQSLDVNVLVVGYVTLSTSGIVSIEPATGNRLPSVAENAASLAALKEWKEAVDPRIATIASEIADLKNRLRSMSQQGDLLAIAADLARVKESVGLPDDYSDYGADHYLDASETATDDMTLLARVEEGIRFAPENAGQGQISVFNPLDANIKMSGGLVLPAYTHTRRLSVQGYVGEASISQYGYQTHDLVQKTVSRQRIRYGAEFTVCTNAAWWQSGRYDPVSNIFTLNGETFNVISGNPAENHQSIRVRQFWLDTYTEPYWECITTNHSIQGACVAQSFLNSQDGWLTRVSVWFTRLAGSGNVTLAITELTDSGSPHLAKAICVQSVPYATLKIGWTTMSIAPTFLKAGKRYALLLISNADHWIGMADGNNYAQGTFFYSTDSVFYAGDLTRDMMFALDFAAFTNPRVEVQLAPLQLSGGVAAIDLVAQMVTTHIAGLTFEVQIAGRWSSINEVTPNLLIGLPPLLPFRAVFIGTTDVQAGLFLTGSVVKVSRPRTTFHHVSTSRLLAASTQTVHVIFRLEGWNADHHAFNCTLKTALGVVSADAVETRDFGVDPATGQRAIQKTFLFHGGITAPITSYQIVCDGSTTTALDCFHVAERVDVAF